MDKINTEIRRVCLAVFTIAIDIELKVDQMQM